MSDAKTFTAEVRELLEIVETQKKLNAGRHTGTLGALITLVEELKEAREKADEKDGDRNKGLGESITTALDKLAGSLISFIKSQKQEPIDLTPIAKSIADHQKATNTVLSEIKDQHTKLLQAFTSSVRGNDTASMETIRQLISQSAQTLETKLTSSQEKQFEKLENIITQMCEVIKNSKPKSITFEIERAGPRGQIVNIVSKIK